VDVERAVLVLGPACGSFAHAGWAAARSISLREVGEHREALTIHREAVALRRELAPAEPTRYTPDLASSLNNLGVGLREAGEPDQALRLAAEAAAWWGRLARARPDEFGDRYREAQAKLARRFAEAGHQPGAAFTAEEAATRELAPPTVRTYGSQEECQLTDADSQ